MTRTRRRLLLAGLLPALLAVLFAAEVGLMLANDSSGRGLFDDGDHPAAAEEFAANQQVNLLQPWLAHFDEGAAVHAGGDPDAAIDAYAEALETVPAEHECLVRINLALALEARGDAAERDDRVDDARADWRAAVEALDEGRCRIEDRLATGNDRKRRQDRDDRPERAADEEQLDGRTLADRAADARATARRLEEKLATPQPKDDARDPKEQEVEENNEQAEQEREEIEEDVELRDSEDHPTW